jgi:hypothetical protein
MPERAIEPPFISDRHALSVAAREYVRAVEAWEGGRGTFVAAEERWNDLAAAARRFAEVEAESPSNVAAGPSRRELRHVE